jgi:hypothetical protein
MRSTLLTNSAFGIRPDSQYCRDPAQFYQGDTTSFYAKYIHENNVENKAYAFGIDDNCHQSSYVQVSVPKQLTVTLVAQ